jgi:hypothetical protein
MAKRTSKPPKKREQPWMAAARRALHKGSADAPLGRTGAHPEPEAHQGPDEEAVARALLEMARPELDALGADATDATIEMVVSLAMVAYNDPILRRAVEATPEVARLAAAVESLHESLFASLPEARAWLARMLETRSTRFGHLTRPIRDVKPRRTGGVVSVVVTLEPEGTAEHALGEDSERPKISASLLELARPALEALPAEAEEEAKRSAVRLAELAWNLPTLERPEARMTDALRERMREVHTFVEELPPEVRAMFDAMVEVRRTRFADDPRSIVSTRLEMRGGRLWLDVEGAYPD